tara:strand:- start:33 stop:275 length:243 start_codon:yes stop_codon:yes gene_type:complete
MDNDEITKLGYLPLYDHSKSKSEEIAETLITEVLAHGNAYFGMMPCFDMCNPEKLTGEDTELLQMIVEIAGSQSSTEAAA